MNEQVGAVVSGTAPAATPLYRDVNGAEWQAAISDPCRVYAWGVDTAGSAVFIPIYAEPSLQVRLGYMRRDAVRTWLTNRPQE